MRGLLFKFWDAGGTVAGLIESWEPVKCESEKDLERSLVNHLVKELPEIPVVRQYGWNRARIDIVAGDKVAIEIKHNLNSTGKYQRLVGQMTDYKGWKGPLIVVLCGETDQNLHRQLSRHFTNDWVVSQEVKIIAKR